MEKSEKEIIQQIAEHFRSSRYLYYYTKNKLKADPVYQAVLQTVMPLKIPLLDIGCGVGLLEYYLRQHGWDIPCLGVDLAAEKIERANTISRNYHDLEFQVVDARNAVRPGYSIALLDILHFLKDEEQQDFLQRCAAGIPEGGVVMIRNGVKMPGWRYPMTVAEEIFVRGIGWMVGGPMNFPTIEEILAPFESAGFEAHHEPLWGNTPFSSMWFVFRKM